MSRTYAEMLYLFWRFYEKRSDLNPLLSAGALLAAVQLLCFVDVVLVLSWSGVLVYDFSHYKMLVAIAAAVLSILNFLILRAGRAARLVAGVEESSLKRAQWSLAGVVGGTIFTILLYKGLVVSS